MDVEDIIDVAMLFLKVNGQLEALRKDMMKFPHRDCVVIELERRGRQCFLTVLKWICFARTYSSL